MKNDSMDYSEVESQEGRFDDGLAMEATCGLQDGVVVGTVWYVAKKVLIISFLSELSPTL